METHWGMTNPEGQTGQPALLQGPFCHYGIGDTSNDPDSPKGEKGTH